MYVCFVCFSPDYMLKCKEDAEKPMQNCNATHLREGTSSSYIPIIDVLHVILNNFNLCYFFRHLAKTEPPTNPSSRSHVTTSCQ